ncbi:uncharacterized protein [Haliotis asinina]|uniref:uncharacterized protein n=1 Tax=Haliotis asinina TaxID=109174 RepID=UPI003531E7F8
MDDGGGSKTWSQGTVRTGAVQSEALIRVLSGEKEHFLSWWMKSGRFGTSMSNSKTKGANPTLTPYGLRSQSSSTTPVQPNPRSSTFGTQQSRTTQVSDSDSNQSTINADIHHQPDPNTSTSQVEEREAGMQQPQNPPVTMTVSHSPLFLDKFREGANVKLFLNRLRHSFKINKYSADHQKIIIPTPLEGSAKVWFDSMAFGMETDVETQLQAIEDRYSQTSLNPASLLMQQLPTETVNQYIDRYLSGLSGDDVPVNIQVRVALQGLKPELRKVVGNKEPKTLSNLRRHALLAEQLEMEHLPVQAISTKDPADKLAGLLESVLQRFQSQPQYQHPDQYQPEQHQARYPQQHQQQFQSRQHQLFPSAVSTSPWTIPEAAPVLPSPAPTSWWLWTSTSATTGSWISATAY